MTQPEIFRVRVLVPAHKLAHPAISGADVLGWVEVVASALEHQARMAARRGEIELAPDWSITEVRHELLQSRYSDEQVISAEGVILGARKPGTAAGDV
jgi:hypothetical protein